VIYIISGFDAIKNEGRQMIRFTEEQRDALTELNLFAVEEKKTAKRSTQ